MPRAAAADPAPASATDVADAAAAAASAAVRRARAAARRTRPARAPFEGEGGARLRERVIAPARRRQLGAAAPALLPSRRRDACGRHPLSVQPTARRVKAGSR
eukprot:357473-Chlamydomonas_euryale.AAC.1